MGAGAPLAEVAKAVPRLIAQAQPTKQERQGTPGVLMREPSSLAFSRWINEDVTYIITKDEHAAWDRLGSDEDREKFIQQFWARRDPTPATDVNEYKDEHYRRIAYVNERFGFADRAGWQTDRGRIYIMYGPPNEIEAHPSGGAYTRPAEQGGGTTYTSPFEKWRYRWIEGMGNNVIIEFVDQTATGEYRMTMDPSAKDAAMYVPGSQDRQPVQRFSRVDGAPVQQSTFRPVVPIFPMIIPMIPKVAPPVPPPAQVVQGVALQVRDILRLSELAALRARYTDEHPEVLAAAAQLKEALQVASASGGGSGFGGKHSGALVYRDGRVTFVVPLEGAGPFQIDGRIMSASGRPVSYFEEAVPNAAQLNFTRTLSLKPGSYIFVLTMNGTKEISTFEVK